MQTLDGSGKPKRLGLLTLNGNVAGARIAIVKPTFVAPLEPLHGPVVSMAGAQMDMLENLQDAQTPQVSEPSEANKEAAPSEQVILAETATESTNGVATREPEEIRTDAAAPQIPAEDKPSDATSPTETKTNPRAKA